MRGQVVVCKDFIGMPLVLHVWEDSCDLVFAHSKDQYESHLKGNPHLEPVGFPIEDVFLFDEAALSLPDPFSRLTPYAESRS
jgi:hypothetical protein